MSASPVLRCIDDRHCVLGEGACWHGSTNVFLWTDIMGRAVYSWDPVTNAKREYAVPGMVSTIVPLRSADASAPPRVVVALDTRVATLNLASGELTDLAQLPPSELADGIGRRFNDGKADPAGRLLVGTVALPTVSDVLPDATGVASLYRLDDADAHGHSSFTPLVRGVSVSNGISWSADTKRMYYIDSLAKSVVCYEYDNARGALGECKTVIRTGDEDAAGLPDGCALDVEEHLWVAHWDGGKVVCYDPADGRALRSVQLPTPRVTSIAFGGATGRSALITTASVGLDAHTDAYKHAGNTWFIEDMGVAGLPAHDCLLTRV